MCDSGEQLPGSPGLLLLNGFSNHTRSMETPILASIPVAQMSVPRPRLGAADI